MKNNTKGGITLYIGPMFARKSSSLIRDINRYKIAKKKCVCIKFKGDDRYSKTEIVSHDGIKIKALSCTKLAELDKKLDRYDVVNKKILLIT